MSLRLYDTATRSQRPLAQLQPGHVGVYVCGPTVQARPHVGHLRSAIAVDVLHRWLLASGLTVTFVRNITDIDDKIIHDASHDDEPWWALATRMTRAFTQAYDAVQVLPPTAEPRVTGSIPSITALIERIIERGHGYASGGDVYLSVRTVPGYGGLSGQNPDQLKASDKTVAHGHTGAKKDPLDFALWKAAKPGEPSWPSPWGAGRPGWHIECSAMAVDHLGESFDLHAGGVDLVFPHHENELAQSQCAGHGFAQHWLHHGLVTLAGGEKMSKSTGTATLAQDVLATVRPQVLRYALGSGHYRSPLEWSPQTVSDAEAAYGRIETFVRHASEATAGLEFGPGELAPSTPAWAEFASALDDDLGVPQALAIVHSQVRAGNVLLAARELPALAATLADLRRMLAVLALDPVDQWPSQGAGELSGVVDALVAIAVEARADARTRKDWAQADAVRDRLNSSGIVLEDTVTDGVAGVRWRLT